MEKAADWVKLMWASFAKGSDGNLQKVYKAGKSLVEAEEKANGQAAEAAPMEEIVQGKAAENHRDPDITQDFLNPDPVTYGPEMPVQRAICSHVQAAVAVKKVPFRRVSVPPDGHCFWHSVNGAMNKDHFLNLPRTNGFAKDCIAQQRESLGAKQLRERATAFLLEMLPRADCERCLHNVTDTSCVDFTDVKVIGEVLRLDIRSTMQDQARCCHMFGTHMCILAYHMYTCVCLLYKYND